MNQTPSRGTGRHGTKTPTKTPIKKGLFTDGIWKCNCDPRLPADHFQTKNGGPNHGRWFYTCQKPQTKRCGFFLWDNEAKPREARAVLANSHTEPYAPTELNTSNETTPNKDFAAPKSPVTPYSKAKSRMSYNSLPARNTIDPIAASRDNDWLYVSDDDFNDPQLLEAVDSPSKIARTTINTSPSKHNHSGFQENSSHLNNCNRDPAEMDTFRTPNEIRGRGLFSGAQTAPQNRATGRLGGLVSPDVTPATTKFGAPFELDGELIARVRDGSPTARKSTVTSQLALGGDTAEMTSKSQVKDSSETPLAKELLDALQSAIEAEGETRVVTERITSSVRAISFKHVANFNNVQKGRDWCREKIKKQDIRIAELEAEVGRLKIALGKK